MGDDEKVQASHQNPPKCLNISGMFQQVRVKHDQTTHVSRLYKSMIKGSLEVKLPTIWTNEKQRWEELERREEEERKRKSSKKDTGARHVINTNDMQ